MAFLFERAVIAASTFLIATSVRAAPAMQGFAPARAEAERALEARFDAALSAAEIRARLQSMAAEPNHVGSPHGKANAEFTRDQFRAWGWDARIETFSVLYPTPKELLLELLGPAPFKATLTEPPLDATSGHTQGALPAYVAYQGDGEAQDQVARTAAVFVAASDRIDQATAALR